MAWWAAPFPEAAQDVRWSLDVETFVKRGDLSYAVDMGGGVLVLRETGGPGAP